MPSPLISLDFLQKRVGVFSRGYDIYIPSSTRQLYSSHNFRYRMYRELTLVLLLYTFQVHQGSCSSHKFRYRMYRELTLVLLLYNSKFTKAVVAH